MWTLDVQIPVVKWIYPCLESIVYKFSPSTLQGTNISHIEGRGKSSSKSTWKGFVQVRLRRVVLFLILFLGDLDIPNTWGIIIDWRHPPNRELYITEGLPNGLLGYPYFGEPSHHLLNCSELIIWCVGFISWISPTNSSFPIKCWRESNIKSLKRRFWCFLESWSAKLTKRIDIIIFKQARPVPDHFQVSMLLFFRVVVIWNVNLPIFGIPKLKLLWKLWNMSRPNISQKFRIPKNQPIQWKMGSYTNQPIQKEKQLSSDQGPLDGWVM